MSKISKLNLPPEEDLKIYISRQELLALLFDNHTLAEVTYPDFVHEYKNKSKKIRLLENSLLVLSAGLILAPLVFWLDGQKFDSQILLYPAVSAIALTGWRILKEYRFEPNLLEYQSRVTKPKLYARLLTYFKALKQSNYSIKKVTSSGIEDVGKIHMVDFGIVSIIGTPKDRYAIRKFGIGHKEFYFPTPAALGLKFETLFARLETPPDQIVTRILQENDENTIDLNTIRGIKTEISNTNLTIENLADLSIVLQAGKNEIFEAIYRMSLRRAKSNTKKHIVEKTFFVLRYAHKHKIQEPHETIDFPNIYKPQYNTIANGTFKKIASGSHPASKKAISWLMHNK